jgi:hypothetical protein
VDEDMLRTVARQVERRSINNGISGLAYAARAPVPSDVLQVWCECGADECAEVISVRRGEYDAARLDERRFVVAHDHCRPGVDVPVVTSERFDLVETTDEATHVLSVIGGGRRGVVVDAARTQ